jgi:hypothetical protein
MNYKNKYIKYKLKYKKIKQLGGTTIEELKTNGINIVEISTTQLFNTFQDNLYPVIDITFDNKDNIIPNSFIAFSNKSIEEAKRIDELFIDNLGYGLNNPRNYIKSVILYNNDGDYNKNVEYIKNYIPRYYRIILLVGGLNKFRKEYPNLVDRYKILDNIELPSHIPQFNIFIGSQGSATHEVIDILNINSIINLAGSDYRGTKNFYNNKNKYKCINNINNSYGQNIIPVINDCFKFYNENKDYPILIHCSRGKSRSVAIVIGIIMMLHNLSYSDALQIVKESRDIAEPNKFFERQLLLLAEKLH